MQILRNATILIIYTENMTESEPRVKGFSYTPTPRRPLTGSFHPRQSPSLPMLDYLPACLVACSPECFLYPSPALSSAYLHRTCLPSTRLPLCLPVHLLPAYHSSTCIPPASYSPAFVPVHSHILLVCHSATPPSVCLPAHHPAFLLTCLLTNQSNLLTCPNNQPN